MLITAALIVAALSQGPEAAREALDDLTLANVITKFCLASLFQVNLGPNSGMADI